MRRDQSPCEDSCPYIDHAIALLHQMADRLEYLENLDEVNDSTENWSWNARDAEKQLNIARNIASKLREWGNGLVDQIDDLNYEIRELTERIG